MTEGTNTPAELPHGGMHMLTVSNLGVSAHMQSGGRVKVAMVSGRVRVEFGDYSRDVTVYLPEDVAVQLLDGLGEVLYGATPEQGDDASAVTA